MMPRLFRFLLSGGSAAAVEYAIFLLLQTQLGADWLLLNQSVSFTGGFIVSFMLNRHWVFRSEGAWGGELARYGLLAAVNLVLGNVAISLLAGPLGVPPLLAKLIVMVMVASWNYVIFSRLVFRQRPTA